MDPQASSAFRTSYDAARSRVAVVNRQDRGYLKVTGADRRSFLHALFTNDIAALSAGRGCYTAYLTPQGRMITDFRVYELGDAILLELDRSLASSMHARLDDLVFAEDVQIADVTATLASVALVGPEATAATAGILQGLDESSLRVWQEHDNGFASFEGNQAIVVRIADLGEPGYRILVPAASGPALDAALAGLPHAGGDVADTLRIEAGVPKFLVDMNEDTIPLEAGIESRAISMTKGCYVGQEVIVRVLHRGHGRVAERLVTLALDVAAPPAAGTEVMVDGQRAGRVTSSTMSPRAGRSIALAYVQRVRAAVGQPVLVDGVPGVVTAVSGLGPSDETANELGVSGRNAD
jgi:folate-binding protein YgfZ